MRVGSARRVSRCVDKKFQKTVNNIQLCQYSVQNKNLGLVCTVKSWRNKLYAQCHHK